MSTLALVGVLGAARFSQRDETLGAVEIDRRPLAVCADSGELAPSDRGELPLDCRRQNLQ